MSDTTLLRNHCGFHLSSLNHILNVIGNEDEDNEDEGMSIIKHSPYVNYDELISFCNINKDEFTVLNLNIQSINAKFDQFQIFLHQLKLQQFEFSIICLQETWLTENSDLSLFEINGYTLTTQHAVCSSHSGLAVYLNEKYDHKILPLYEKSAVWEGLFLEITGHSLEHKIMLGNIYRPPRERNENYQQFIKEIIPIVSTFDKNNNETIITGDFNINLLKVNEKPIVNEFFDIMTSHSFTRKLRCLQDFQGILEP